MQEKAKAREVGATVEGIVAMWVAGEPASVEVQISNPTESAMKVRSKAWVVSSHSPPKR